MRSSIFSQIWIPLSLLTVGAVCMLVIYYPSEQRQLFKSYKQAELSTIGRTIAAEVEHALDQNDYSGLINMMSSLIVRDWCSPTHLGEIPLALCSLRTIPSK
jgi:hypothetical protein